MARAAAHHRRAADMPDANREAELDQMIMNAAIMNGALEIMPHTLATMAIVPLQMRLVYRIGHAYGYELDRGPHQRLSGDRGHWPDFPGFRGIHAAIDRRLCAEADRRTARRIGGRSHRLGVRFRLHLRHRTSGQKILRQRTNPQRRRS